LFADEVALKSLPIKVVVQPPSPPMHSPSITSRPILVPVPGEITKALVYQECIIQTFTATNFLKDQLKVMVKGPNGEPAIVDILLQPTTVVVRCFPSMAGKHTVSMFLLGAPLTGVIDSFTVTAPVEGAKPKRSKSSHHKKDGKTAQGGEKKVEKSKSSSKHSTSSPDKHKSPKKAKSKKEEKKEEKKETKAEVPPLSSPLTKEKSKSSSRLNTPIKVSKSSRSSSRQPSAAEDKPAPKADFKPEHLFTLPPIDKSIPIKELKADVSAPRGENIPGDVVQVDGEMRVHFVPSYGGRYLVRIFHKERDLFNGPLPIEIPDVTSPLRQKSTEEKPGAPAYKEENLFSIPPIDASVDRKKIEVKITGPRNDAFTGEIVQHQGENKLHFKPTHIGRYTAQFSFNGADLFNSSLPIDVRRNGLNLQKIVLPLSIIGESGFELELGKLKDRYGRLFDVIASQMTCDVNPDGVDYSVSILNSTVKIVFRPRVSGSYTAQVLCGGEPVLREPLKFDAEVNPDFLMSPRFRQQQIRTDKLKVGSGGLRFTLQPITDVLGNRIDYLPETDLRVEVKGPQTIKGDTERTPEGKLLVKVKPTIGGDYTAQVYLFSLPILVDPISFYVEIKRSASVKDDSGGNAGTITNNLQSAQPWQPAQAPSTATNDVPAVHSAKSTGKQRPVGDAFAAFNPAQSNAQDVDSKRLAQLRDRVFQVLDPIVMISFSAFSSYFGHVDRCDPEEHFSCSPGSHCHRAAGQGELVGQQAQRSWRRDVGHGSGQEQVWSL